MVLTPVLPQSPSETGLSTCFIGLLLFSSLFELFILLLMFFFAFSPLTPFYYFSYSGPICFSLYFPFLLFFSSFILNRFLPIFLQFFIFIFCISSLILHISFYSTHFLFFFCVFFLFFCLVFLFYIFPCFLFVYYSCFL